MITVVIVGTGNVATHLVKAFFSAKGIDLVQVLGRKEKNLQPFKAYCQVSVGYQRFAKADVYLIAVADRAIAEVATELTKAEGLVVHTSGSTEMDAIQKKRRGVFYPLQTFSKARAIDFSQIPICIEAQNNEDHKLLQLLGSSISRSVHAITTPQRRRLHLAAVFTNNFTNHLLYISNQICEEAAIDFEVLVPLMEETFSKLKHLSPFNAQTGPARRNDIETMQQHLDGLKNSFYKKVYLVLSESIKKTYEEKL